MNFCIKSRLRYSRTFLVIPWSIALLVIGCAEEEQTIEELVELWRSYEMPKQLQTWLQENVHPSEIAGYTDIEKSWAEYRDCKRTFYSKSHIRHLDVIKRVEEYAFREAESGEMNFKGYRYILKPTHILEFEYEKSSYVRVPLVKYQDSWKVVSPILVDQSKMAEYLIKQKEASVGKAHEACL